MQLTTFQAVVAVDGNLSVTIFTYQCGMLNMETDSNTGAIGFAASKTFYENHYLSLKPEINSIACLNSPLSNWSNVIYQVSQGEKKRAYRF